MKKYYLIKNNAEIHMNKCRIPYRGITTEQEDQESIVLEKFDTEKEALNELKKMTSSAEKRYWTVPFWDIEEFYVQEMLIDEDDEDEEYIESGDVLEFARMEIEQSESEKVNDIIEKYGNQTVTPEELGELEDLEVVEHIEDCGMSSVYHGYRIFNIVFTDEDEAEVRCRIS